MKWQNLDEELEERVRQHICEKCGNDFDKPGSCEECIDDSEIQLLFEYELKQAKRLGEKYFI